MSGHASASALVTTLRCPQYKGAAKTGLTFERGVTMAITSSTFAPRTWIETCGPVVTLIMCCRPVATSKS